MTRTRMALTLTMFGLAGLLALSACGAGTAQTVAADVADEVIALQALGLETAPAPSAPAEPGRGRDGIRKHLRKNTLHGEMTVQGKDGVRTIVVQRGTVTAADAKSVSVRSADGFALTWTLGDKLRVVQDRKKVELSAVKVGGEVGVAGARTGDAATARLIAVQ
jgi:hypothetical protein